MVTSQKMIKKGLKKDMTDFLQILNKLSDKKRRQINKNKRKSSLEETNSRKATISNLDNFKKNKLLFPIPAIVKIKPQRQKY